MQHKRRERSRQLLPRIPTTDVTLFLPSPRPPALPMIISLHLRSHSSVEEHMTCMRKETRSVPGIANQKDFKSAGLPEAPLCVGP